MTADVAPAIMIIGAWVAVSAVFAVVWSLTVGRLPKDDDQ